MKTILFTTNNLKSREAVRDQIDFLNAQHKGKEVDYILTIKKKMPVRSVSQNSYYWVVLQAIAVKTGYTTDDLHEWYKLEYNSKEVLGKKIAGSTTTIYSAEFTIYLKKVKEHATSFHDVYVADPKDRFYSVWEAQTKERYDAMFMAI